MGGVFEFAVATVAVLTWNNDCSTLRFWIVSSGYRRRSAQAAVGRMKGIPLRILLIGAGVGLVLLLPFAARSPADNGHGAKTSIGGLNVLVLKDLAV